jgi:hypothetical protein
LKRRPSRASLSNATDADDNYFAGLEMDTPASSAESTKMKPAMTMGISID